MTRILLFKAMMLLGILLGGGAGGGSGAIADAAAATRPAVDLGAVNPKVGMFYLHSTLKKFQHVPMDGVTWPTDLDNFLLEPDRAFSFLDNGHTFAINKPKSRTVDVLMMYQTATLKPIFTAEVPSKSVLYGPVFGRKDHYILRVYDERADRTPIFLVNPRASSMVRKYTTQGWDDDLGVMPNGDVHLANTKTGRIALMGEDGVLKTVGQLPKVMGHFPITVRLSHNGRRIALYYGVYGSDDSLLGTDIFVANWDGTGLYRLTNYGFIGNPVWLPDDSGILVTVDTISRVAGGTIGHVIGNCGVFLLPADARDVNNFAFDTPNPLAKEVLVAGYHQCGLLTVYER